MEEYLKEYVILIELSKYRGINKKVLTGYYEKHHIIPKCVGGEDKPNNYVLLTYREHIKAHYLLTKIYPENEKIAYAYFRTCNSSGGSKEEILNFSSYELFEDELICLENSKRLISISTSKRFLGKKKSDDHRKKISESKLGDKNPMYGKHLSEETKIKLSKLNKGRKLSVETRRKISESQIGKKRIFSETHKRNISKSLTGKHISEKTKKKLSLIFGKKVIGPDGTVYNSQKECANSLNIGVTTLKRWILNKPEKGFRYL